MTAADQSDQTVENPLAKRPSTYDDSKSEQLSLDDSIDLDETVLTPTRQIPSLTVRNCSHRFGAEAAALIVRRRHLGRKNG